MQFTGTDKQRGIYNGQAGTVRGIEGDQMTVVLDGKRQKVVEFDAGGFQDFRHGYAGTIYKGQGRTIDQTYLFHSEHWRAAASYVALTRHSSKTQMFVSRDTAADMNELAWQMARIDDRRAASHFREAEKPVITREPDSATASGSCSRLDTLFRPDRDYRYIINAAGTAGQATGRLRRRSRSRQGTGPITTLGELA